MFFLVNSFLRATGILKQSYAEVIVILMKDSDYFIDEVIIDEVVSYVSLDSLISYGAESTNSTFSKKCVSEFWKRVPNIEDKKEFTNNVIFRRIRLKNVLNIKKKGDVK